MLILLGIVIGFLIAKLVAGKNTGDRTQRAIRIPVGNIKVHIHHWIWASVILIVFILLKFQNYFLMGILVGIMIQGLSYTDRFKIIER
jgi:hypothetical protein